jgi:hypothetical protein
VPAPSSLFAIPAQPARGAAPAATPSLPARDAAPAATPSLPVRGSAATPVAPAPSARVDGAGDAVQAPEELPPSAAPVTPAVQVPASVPVADGMADVLRQRSALASEALTELSRLSAYSPAAVETKPPATLSRRTPASTPAAQVAPARPAAATRRTRNAADVRSMLSGFQAGVERGRTTPSDPTETDTAARPTGGQA